MPNSHSSVAAIGPGRGLWLIAAAFLALAAGACQMNPVVRVQDKVEGGQPPGRVAVVAGQRTRHCALLAERITGKLAATGSVDALSQEEIAARLGVYPANLSADSFLAEKEASDQALSEANRAICARVLEKLGVDYVLLVWFHEYEFYRVDFYQPAGRGTTTSYYYYIQVRGRLVGFPGASVTGAVDYGINANFVVPLFTLRHTEFLAKMIDKAAGSIVKRIGRAWQ